ncbi:lysine--tRNA ligase [Brucepastera parasyntrophica]|uniref:lysine--tRNA ligase n=1 Tax=Brucepastera parasyntrophica TaxID=2880008 RepID=UPI002108E6C3|nr:lysine--tRNA ligase [Brucepastera parasyntrophica]ULQ59729.1 lysine--tRNA ligase [Brucepastera parasyntrophica]
MKYEIKGGSFWLDEVADALLLYLDTVSVSANDTITCAAGMTPSCPIHFGILREIAISHFVAEELSRRGRKTRLIYYWDDFDHFCKIPWFTTREAIKDHIGKPLGKVPDFQGGYPSYGEHYMKVFEDGLKTIGIHPEYNYQSQVYASGAYLKYIRQAIEKRDVIFDIINGEKKPYDDKLLAAREAYYPLEVYCSQCQRDLVTVTGYDQESDSISYECRACGTVSSYTLNDSFFGKLMWKANWAMRWTDDIVRYESSGENQLTETGSYAVSSRIAEQVFGGQAPFSLLYRFIGIPGIAKVSRAQGEKSLSTRLTDLLEPAIIRWLFLKNSPDKPFSIDMDNGLNRMYHEWDLFMTKITDGSATAEDKRIFGLATKGVEFCRYPIPFRTVIAATGIAGGDEKKAAELLRSIHPYKDAEPDFFTKVLPRIKCTKNLSIHTE